MMMSSIPLRLVVAVMPMLGACAVTPFQDGHHDACSPWAGPKHHAAEQGVADHDQCFYWAYQIGLDTAEMDGYTRGVQAGVERCWQQPYDEAWFEADATSPCGGVEGDPLPEERP